MAVKLNMSSLLACHAIISSSAQNSTLSYLRKNDPAYSHLDWQTAKFWLTEISFETNEVSFEEVCRAACMYFIRNNPLLLEMGKYGRSYVVASLDPDETQVFLSGELLNKNPSREIVKWWDSIKLLSRKNLNESLLLQGREAEEWTMELEEKFLEGTGLKPEWVSLDNDQYGYDVLSYRKTSDGSYVPIQIEVKSFSRENYPQFFVTENEWEMAKNAPVTYQFHVWYTGNKTCKSLKTSAVQGNIPKNQGSGKWQSVLVSIDWKKLDAVDYSAIASPL